jgi:hypothetical protein
MSFKKNFFCCLTVVVITASFTFAQDHIKEQSSIKGRQLNDTLNFYWVELGLGVGGSSLGGLSIEATIEEKVIKLG